MESAEAKHLTLKMAFLLAITSLRRVGDLQALSVTPRCLEFAPGNVRAILHPFPGYVPEGAVQHDEAHGTAGVSSSTSCDGGEREASSALPRQSTEYFHSEVIPLEEGRPVAGVFRVPQGWAPRFQAYYQQLDRADYLPGLSGAQIAFTYGRKGSLHERHGSLHGSPLWSISAGGL